MKRIVHLDLKGAPPTVPFLEEIIIQAKKWRATGFLFEWEDTFPYDGVLADIGSKKSRDGMYTLEEVKHIMQFMRENDMEAIQLIQCMGHMEFVLKHPAFRSLREDPRSPSALCPLRERALDVVVEMAMQVLNVQPDAKYLHIGADEVWHLGVCPDCKALLSRTGAPPYSLLLRHAAAAARAVRARRPGVQLLLWDDMLRGVSAEEIIASGLGDLAQPVVWSYGPQEHLAFPATLWRTYRQVFTRCWAASAFKGANGSCQIVSPVHRYVSNNVGWLMEMQRYRNEVDFAGIIITGWSRYDHYAALCELLPAAMPSLANCLKVVAEAEHCAVPKEVQLIEPPWHPGQRAATAIATLASLRDAARALLHGDAVLTWMNPWQMANNYTNPMHVDSIARNAHQLQSELLLCQDTLRSELPRVTGRASAAEWLHTTLTPILAQITSLYEEADRRRNMDAGVAPSQPIENPYNLRN